MNRRNQETSPQTATVAGRWAYLTDRRTFVWHLRIFLTANVALSLANAFTGRFWWAFWPLVVTGLLLAIHYFIYKASAVDERWADERVEELNLKSYDRSHIENLKARLGGEDRAGRRREG